jgi:hypothetical protein
MRERMLKWNGIMARWSIVFNALFVAYMWWVALRPRPGLPIEFPAAFTAECVVVFLWAWGKGRFANNADESV